MKQSELDALLDEFKALKLDGQNNLYRFRAQSFVGLSFAERNLEGIDLRRCDLTGCDFTGSNLANAIFALADLTGVDFTDADISNTTFEKATFDPTQFVGAIWNGVLITEAMTAVENRLTTLITNAFSQLGCLQKTNEEWLSLSPADRATLYPSDPSMIEDFWANVQHSIESQLTNQ